MSQLEDERLIGLKDNMVQTGHSDGITLFTDFPKHLRFLVSLEGVFFFFFSEP